MKTKYLLLVLITTFIACKNDSDLADNADSPLTLETFDYFEEAIPFEETFQMTRYTQVENHDEVAALGRILFYDTRLSQNNSIACASCHKQELGFADGKQFSDGVRNYQTSRNAMTLVNNGYQNFHFWEGHSGLVEDHVLNPISNHIEMGMKDVNELVEKLSEIEAYNELFKEVYFGLEISEPLIKSSLSTFIASIVSYNSKFDRGEEVGFTNFTLAEKNGKELFFGKAKCGSCHKGDHYTASWRDNVNIGLEMEYEDQGAGNGSFKVPSLRNIELTGPYMHDGRFQTLEEVVNHYVNGVQDHPELDWVLNQNSIDLTELEQTQLVAFLKTLTDHSLTSDKRFSNPF